MTEQPPEVDVDDDDDQDPPDEPTKYTNEEPRGDLQDSSLKDD